MKAIELKFKLDLLFEYIIPGIITFGFVFLFIIAVIVDKIKTKRRKKHDKK